VKISMDQLITSNNRPYKKMTPTTLTIHETDNRNRGADAKAHRNYLQNSFGLNKSWHWVVDDKEAILCIPENEMAWHAGPKANANSLSMEICVNIDADPAQVYLNAIKLASEILERWGLNERDLRTHQMWIGKNCPKQIIAEKRWPKFVDDVRKSLSSKIRIQGAIFPVQIIGGRSYMLVRPVLEHLGYKIDWKDGEPITATYIGKEGG